MGCNGNHRLSRHYKPSCKPRGRWLEMWTRLECGIINNAICSEDHARRRPVHRCFCNENIAVRGCSIAGLPYSNTTEFRKSCSRISVPPAHVAAHQKASRLLVGHDIDAARGIQAFFFVESLMYESLLPIPVHYEN